MRKAIPINVYTQINTDDTTYLIQNLSSDDLMIVVSDTQPDDHTDCDYMLRPYHGISGEHVVGICWGKPTGKKPLTVGLTEG